MFLYGCLCNQRKVRSPASRVQRPQSTVQSPASSVQRPTLVSRVQEFRYAKSNRLHKIFNRNVVKLSYSCMENVSQIIKKHNKRVTKKNERSIATCNCRDKNNCPMNGDCRVENLMYKFLVSATEKSKEYVYIHVAESD